jgi:hypothetical protein
MCVEHFTKIFTIDELSAKEIGNTKKPIELFCSAIIINSQNTSNIQSSIFCIQFRPGGA